MTSKFSFQTENCEMSNDFVNVTKSDALFNFTKTETQLMNGNVPWRGPREKDPLFLRILIEQLTKPGDIVLDWKAGTGKHLLIRFAFFTISHRVLSLTLYVNGIS